MLPPEKNVHALIFSQHWVSLQILKLLKIRQQEILSAFSLLFLLAKIKFWLNWPTGGRAISRNVGQPGFRPFARYSEYMKY